MLPQRAAEMMRKPETSSMVDTFRFKLRPLVATRRSMLALSKSRAAGPTGRR